jgi:hypothetical protein
VTDQTTDALVAAMTRLDEREGALLASGHSYHYYGFVPRDLAGWRLFMARAILLAPLADERFIAHCLIEDLACLRLDATGPLAAEPSLIRPLREDRHAENGAPPGAVD